MLDLSDFSAYTYIVANGIKRSDLLTAAEEEFVCDMRDKLVKYRRSTHVSEKQGNWLRSIEAKLRIEMGHTYEEASL